MKLTIEIEMSNDAFGLDSYDQGQQVDWILKGLPELVMRAERHGPVRLRDINGNTVGELRVEE